MSTRADAVIIGAGIVGASIAHAFTRAGLRPLVLEPGVAGAGATGAGMGHIVVMDDSPAQMQLTAHARTLLHDLTPQLSPDCELDPCGTLWIAENDEQLAAVHAKHEYYRAHGCAADIMSATDLARAEPQLRTGLAGALHVPADSVIYPPAFCRWLLQHAIAGGARYVNARVARIDAHAAVATDGTRYDADIIVNACGPWAAQLVPELPIIPRRGHLVITDRYPGFCRHQLVELGYLQSAHTFDGASVAFNIQPRRTGQVLIGSSRELVGWDANINRDIVQRMLARALAFMPTLARLNAIRTWIGFRPATPDKLPLIGPWESVPGLWIAAGHEGLGITTALGTAHLLTDLVLGRTPALDAAAFSPARLANAPV